MSAPENWNGNTQRQQEEGHKQDQVPPGERKEMSDPKASSMSTSSPTPTPTVSPSMTGNRSNGKHSETGENPALLSSAPSVESSFTWLQPNSDDVKQRDREGTLVIHFYSFGSAQQKRATAQSMLKNLQVKGFSIIHAALDGNEIR